MQNDLTIKEELTLATFEDDEEWTVKTQDEAYSLNGKQAQALKDLTNQGSRGLIWFKDFAISIPHIVSVKRRSLGNQAIKLKREQLLSKFSI